MDIYELIEKLKKHADGMGGDDGLDKVTVISGDDGIAKLVVLNHPDLSKCTVIMDDFVPDDKKRVNELCAQFVEWLANVSELRTISEVLEILELVEGACKHLANMVSVNADQTWEAK